jgi:hypothetical protein
VANDMAASGQLNMEKVPNTGDQVLESEVIT